MSSESPQNTPYAVHLGLDGLLHLDSPPLEQPPMFPESIYARVGIVYMDMDKDKARAAGLKPVRYLEGGALLVERPEDVS